MKYEDIKGFSQRCVAHPDHQSGMVTNSMIVQRLTEEIDELRAYIESRQWVGLTDEEVASFENAGVWDEKDIRAIEAKLKEKNGA